MKSTWPDVAVTAAMLAGATRLKTRAGRAVRKLTKTKRWDKPHQGARECARRRRQIKSGMLSSDGTQ